VNSKKLKNDEQRSKKGVPVGSFSGEPMNPVGVGVPFVGRAEEFLQAVS